MATGASEEGRIGSSCRIGSGCRGCRGGCDGISTTGARLAELFVQATLEVCELTELIPNVLAALFRQFLQGGEPEARMWVGSGEAGWVRRMGCDAVGWTLSCARLMVFASVFTNAFER